MNFLRIGTAGMRGVVGESLSPSIAMRFASAFGSWVDGHTVLLARDTRHSSLMFHQAALSSLLSAGCHVIDAGVMSAPEMHFLIPEVHAEGGLLIGAGHHPEGWNAITPLDKNGRLLNKTQLQSLLDIYHSHKFQDKAWDQIGKTSRLSEDSRNSYLNSLCEHLDLELIKSSRFRVVIDFCNGSGYEVTKAFLNRLNVELLSINEEASGNLPHDPEPRPRSSQQTKSVVLISRADIGFSFNTDMSRAAIITDSGETLSEEYTFPYALSLIIPCNKDINTIVTNCCSSKTLDQVAEDNQIKVIKSPVGQAAIVEEMLDQRCNFGGDGSGSMACLSHNQGFDNLMLIGLILQGLAQRKRSSSYIAEQLPRYHIIKRIIPYARTHASSEINKILEYFPDAVVSEVDGFRLDWPDGWAHIRLSSTEPVVRLIVEFEDQARSEEIMFHIKGFFE